MTTTQILDVLAPYTPEEKRCGYKKKRKIDFRYRLLLEIEKMQKDGLTNEEILKVLWVNDVLEKTDWLNQSWWWNK